MSIQRINILEILLDWSEWYGWLELINSSQISIPNEPGVYEVRTKDTNEYLTIGKSKNLHRRILRGLVTGAAKHSAGERIRKNEDTSKILIRWATTLRPSAVEDELHINHIEKYGLLPKYTRTTQAHV